MEEEKRSSSTPASSRRRRPSLPVLTCFHPVASSSPPPPSSGAGLRVDRCAPAAGNGVSTSAAPAHLVVMVNGIIGSARDWRFAAKQLVKRFPEDVIVQRSRRNHHTLTFDGVDVMGERLANETRPEPSVKFVNDPLSENDDTTSRWSLLPRRSFETSRWVEPIVGAAAQRRVPDAQRPYTREETSSRHKSSSILTKGGHLELLLIGI